MNTYFAKATADDAEEIARLVYALTEEICQRTAHEFGIDLPGTIQMCRQLISAGHYAVIVGRSAGSAIAVATLAETYALYAGGKIGVIQEFYVAPEFRSTGVGAALLQRVNEHARECGWSCIELCTPPLPEFEKTLAFYTRQGLAAVGGRKMRKHLDNA